MQQTTIRGDERCDVGIGRKDGRSPPAQLLLIALGRAISKKLKGKVGVQKGRHAGDVSEGHSRGIATSQRG